MHGCSFVIYSQDIALLTIKDEQNQDPPKLKRFCSDDGAGSGTSKAAQHHPQQPPAAPSAVVAVADNKIQVPTSASVVQLANEQCSESRNHARISSISGSGSSAAAMLPKKRRIMSETYNNDCVPVSHESNIKSGVDNKCTSSSVPSVTSTSLSSHSLVPGSLCTVTSQKPVATAGGDGLTQASANVECNNSNAPRNSGCDVAVMSLSTEPRFALQDCNSSVPPVLSSSIAKPPMPSTADVSQSADVPASSGQVVSGQRTSDSEQVYYTDV